MKRPILMLLPSRGRPQALAECIGEMTKHGSDLFDILVLQGAAEGVVSVFNSVPPELLRQYSIVGLLGDDCRIRTAGWDKLVDSYLARKPGVLYGRDGIQDEKLCTHPFISTVIPLTLGHVFHPSFKSKCADTALMGLARRADCLQFTPGLFTEHLHWSTGKSVADQNTQRGEAFLDTDLAALDNYERNIMPAEVEIVKHCLTHNK